MGSAEDAVKEKLLWNVKKEVKSGQGPLGARVPARGPGTGGPREGSRFPLPGASAHGLVPGGGGVLDWLRLPPFSRIWGQHPSVRGARAALRRLFAPLSRSSPPCDGNSPGRPRSGEGRRRFLGEVVLTIHCRCRLERGRGPAEPRQNAKRVVWGLSSGLPKPNSGIPLGSESRLREGSSHTSLLLTPRPPPYPETTGGGGGLRMVFMARIFCPLEDSPPRHQMSGRRESSPLLLSFTLALP